MKRHVPRAMRAGVVIAPPAAMVVATSAVMVSTSVIGGAALNILVSSVASAEASFAGPASAGVLAGTVSGVGTGTGTGTFTGTVSGGGYPTSTYTFSGSGTGVYSGSFSGTATTVSHGISGTITGSGTGSNVGAVTGSGTFTGPYGIGSCPTGCSGTGSTSGTFSGTASGTVSAPGAGPSTALLSRGSNISTAQAAATVFVTRTVAGTLSDRNEEAVVGDGTLESTGSSIGEPPALAYAPSASFEAYFPPTHQPVVAGPTYKAFATGFAGGFNISGQNGSYYGGLAGLDVTVMPNLIIGAAAGGSATGSSFESVSAHGSTSGFNGSLYGIVSQGPFYGQSITTFSSFSNQTARSINGGGFSAFETASFGSFEVRERLEFGRVFTPKELPWAGGLKIVPFVAMEVASLHLDGHSEIGNPLAALQTGGQDIVDIPLFLGARLEKAIPLGDGLVLTPIVRAAYVRQLAENSATQNILIGTGTSVFAANTTLLGRDSALVKAGAELSITHNTVVFANFDGLFASSSNIYGGRAGVRVTW